MLYGGAMCFLVDKMELAFFIAKLPSFHMLQEKKKCQKFLHFMIISVRDMEETLNIVNRPHNNFSKFCCNEEFPRKVTPYFIFI